MHERDELDRLTKEIIDEDIKRTMPEEHMLNAIEKVLDELEKKKWTWKKNK